MKKLIVVLAAVVVALGTVACKEEATGNAEGTEVKEVKEEAKDPVDTTAKAAEEKPDTGIVVKETAK